MRLQKVERSSNKNKNYTAIFDLGDKTKQIHFGSKESSTYLDHHDKKQRENYIKRHTVRENFNDPLTAGSLSRWLLWGNTTSLRDNITAFKKRFNL
jgi:hypothetical protein